MNIICIYSVEGSYHTNKPLLSENELPYGLAIIATCLKKAGYAITVLVLTPSQDVESLVCENIDEFRPELCCLTAVTTQFPLIKKIAEVIKKKDDHVFTVLGGVHTTLNPERTISEPCFDAICIGEGEKAVVELADQLASGATPSKINNLWIKKPQEIEKNQLSEYIQDLDSVPIIDRSMWLPWIYDMDLGRSVLIGRGCPNKCTYCCNHALAKVTSGGYIRFRSPDNIIKEIDQILTQNPKVDKIYLECETLTADLEYTYGLLQTLEKYNAGLSTPISFGANISMTRSIVDNQKFLDALKKANFSQVNIGLESGSMRIRKYVLRRPAYSNDEIITFCRDVKKTGIKTFLYVMMGIPTETSSEYKETVDCVKRCAPDSIFLYIFYPYPGTDLYQLAKERGQFSEFIILTETERKKPIMDQPGFSKRKLRIEYVLFYIRSCYGSYPNSKILRLTIGNILAPYPGLIRLIRKI